jgi:hypothetical protein
MSVTVRPELSLYSLSVCFSPSVSLHLPLCTAQVQRLVLAVRHCNFHEEVKVSVSLIRVGDRGRWRWVASAIPELRPAL